MNELKLFQNNLCISNVIHAMTSYMYTTVDYTFIFNSQLRYDIIKHILVYVNNNAIINFNINQ